MSADRWDVLSRAILSALLEQPERIGEVDREVIAPGSARQLFDLLRRRDREGLAIDWPAIRSLPEALAVAGPDYIADLLNLPVSQSGLGAYVKEARDLGLRASLRHAVARDASAEELAEIAGRLSLNGAVTASPPLGVFTDWPTFWARDRSEPEWVVENVLARRRGHALWAKGGNGKSEFMQWVSLEAVRAGHAVVYLDYEMIEDDLFDRLTDFGCGPETDFSRFRYALIPNLRPMDTADGAADVAAMLSAVEGEFPDRHVVVVIDTIGRAVQGEENANDTIMAFYRHTGAVLKQRGTTWVRLDHAGHAGEHARGGSAKRDDVDVVWRHERTDSGCRLLADKRRASWIPEEVHFERREDPVLAYVAAPGSWPAGTSDAAEALNALGVPLDASTRAAQTALSEAGQGRRRAVVAAALRWRRSGAGTTPGTTLAGSEGNRPGTTPPDRPPYGAEPPREPLGTTTAEQVGTGGGPYRGPTGPSSVPGALEGKDLGSAEPGAAERWKVGGAA